MTKPYGKIAFTEDELSRVLGLVQKARLECAKKAQQATDEKEKAFYWNAVEEYKPLEDKLQKPFRDDKSQDAEPEEDEEEDES